MIKLLEVQPHRKNPANRTAIIEVDGIQKEAYVFARDAELVDKTAPGPLPDGWTVREGDYGPILNPPRQARPGGAGPGGVAAWRNTAEGQKYEQERMDRRTALMQAVSMKVDIGDTLTLANDYYEWLRKGA